MKIVITSPVAHDGDILQAGDTVDVPEKVADALIQSGAATMPAPSTKPDRKDGKSDAKAEG